jgi:Ca-activated chloride channel family protein
MQVDKDYYKILGVKTDSTEEQIRQAYRTLAREHHPDVNSDSAANKHFQDIQKAYEVLNDPTQRRNYDRLRESEGLDKSSALSIRSTISHQFLITHMEEQAFYVWLDIAPATDLPTTRLPINLCLVLDRSTSMQGIRLQQVKEATRQIIDRLNPDDALGLVVFSDRAEVILPAQREFDKALAKSVASTIQASGGTEMLQGLLAGLKELNHYRTTASVNHIILLTDGQTYGDEEGCLEQAALAGHNQISLTTMGIGADWNENLLDQMASTSGGSSVYIDSPKKVVDVFKETIRNLSAVVARELTMSINPAANVTLKEGFQITPHIRRLDMQGEKMMLGPLGTDQGKTILMEFRVNRETTPGKKRLARVTVEGDVPGQNNRRNWEWAEIYAEFVPKLEQQMAIPSTIVTALGKLAIFKMQEKAMDDLENGQIGAATQRLETMATRLLNLGETDLARAALLEAGRLARTGDLSAEGRKKIRYGTRSLSILPKEIHRD